MRVSISGGDDGNAVGHGGEGEGGCSCGGGVKGGCGHGGGGEDSRGLSGGDGEDSNNNGSTFEILLKLWDSWVGHWSSRVAADPQFPFQGSNGWHHSLRQRLCCRQHGNFLTQLGTQRAGLRRPHPRGRLHCWRLHPHVPAGADVRERSGSGHSSAKATASAEVVLAAGPGRAAEPRCRTASPRRGSPTSRLRRC